MVNITEDGHYYSAFDHQVHEDKRTFYVDNWLWDTFRALEPRCNPAEPGDGSGTRFSRMCACISSRGVMPTLRS